MRIDVLTLFPEVFAEFFGASIIGRAVTSDIARIFCTNIRDFATDAHRSVDDKPFGGGPGMLLMCEPVFAAVESLSQGSAVEPTRVLLTPQGERLRQPIVEALSREEHLIVVCGHYEGFDERIRTGLGAREISIGDYVLSGGEAAAMVLVDAVVRLLPGAVGDEESVKDESFSSGLLEYPQYTRPRDFRGMKVPDVLVSGNHAATACWRGEQSQERTRRRRPDLLGASHGAPLS